MTEKERKNMNINTVAQLKEAAYGRVEAVNLLSLDKAGFRAAIRAAKVALKADDMAGKADQYDNARAVLGISRETVLAATSPRIKAEALVTLGSATRKASALTKAVEMLNK